MLIVQRIELSADTYTARKSAIAVQLQVVVGKHGGRKRKKESRQRKDLSL
jgi:hypothetical protein